MIQVSNTHPSLHFPKSETFRIVQTVIQSEAGSPRAISVVFVRNRRIRRINRHFLKHDYATDVIVFPFHDDEGVEAEIYVSLDKARSQAKEYGVSFSEETTRLLIHGALHLVGYNDKTVQDRKRMQEKENYFLVNLSETKA